MRARARPSLVLRLVLAATAGVLAASGGVVGCGARSATLDDDDEATCAAADRRARDHCAEKCAAAEPAGRGGGLAATAGASESERAAEDACVESCLDELQRECETTSCRCALALTKLSASGLRR